MTTYDLSILIPARNEEFLALTVEGLLKSIQGNTEIIVGLDGEWANPPITPHPKVTVVYYPESLGQRAMTNQLCKLSNAKWVMKLDAHCKLDEGFDVKLLKDAKDHQTIIPAMYNLHMFDWVCNSCKNRTYQGPTPEKCSNCSGVMAKEIIFKPRLSRRSEFYRFDTTLHFQYHGARKSHPDAQGEIAETMSAQGSCFMLTRKKYWELNICDENFGSWGQQGVEVACKTWLSGGQLVTNKNTWYSHLFRTQGGDFGFPYPLSGRQVEQARKYSRDLFLDNTWEKQIYPLSWLIDKFRPLDNDKPDAPDWHTEKGKEMYTKVKTAGEEFMRKKGIIPGLIATPTKGIIYYTDNALNLKISHAVQKQLKKVNLPITSVSLKPMDFGTNIHLDMKRGYEAYFTQILTALENIDTDVVFFCEHDWLYHPTHFQFTPPNKDIFYYNKNWWRVRASDGFAIKYNTYLLPGIVGYRETLLKHYRQAFEYLKKNGFDSETVHKLGFEPGTQKRTEVTANELAAGFHSEYPIIDIRHDNNLTSSRWSQDQFRSPKNCEGWTEGDLTSIEGWNAQTTDFFEFLKALH